VPSVTRKRSAARDRRGAVEQQVLEAVERLLADGESFTALGVARIAEEAGMARSTFYGHFPDKTKLLLRLTAEATQDLFAQARAWVEDDASTPTGHVDVVLALIRERRKHLPLLRALHEVAAYDPEVEAFWRERIEAFADLIRERLDRDRRAGRIPADVDTRTTATWIAWGTERALAVHTETRPPREDPAFAKGIAAVTWASMRRW